MKVFRVWRRMKKNNAKDENYPQEFNSVKPLGGGIINVTLRHIHGDPLLCCVNFQITRMLSNLQR